MEKRRRAFEIDAFRGYAVIGMILYHFFFDVRYIMGIDAFAFQDSLWFYEIIRPSWTLTFIVVAGISSCFSGNYFRRSGKIFLVSLIFSGAMAVASLIFDMELYVFFNVLHLLTVGTFCYALFMLFERRFLEKHAADQVMLALYKKRVIAGLAVLSALLLFFGRLTMLADVQVNGYWLLPLGILSKDTIGMGDYLPILPWMGFFVIGLLIGRVAYPDRETLFPSISERFSVVTRPLCFLGRHSLPIYLFHQLPILAILFLLRYVNLI